MELSLGDSELDRGQASGTGEDRGASGRDEMLNTMLRGAGAELRGGDGRKLGEQLDVGVVGCGDGLKVG